MGENRLKPTIKNKHIAITGGSGYLGRHLAHRLCIENRVRILDITSPRSMSSYSSKIEFQKCDITNPDECLSSLGGIDIVFHRASLFGNLPSMSEPEKYYNTNLIGTLSILETCVIHKIERLVFDSTEFIYGNQTKLPICEKVLPCPRSVYGATKLAAEDLIRLYVRQFDISSVILRFCRVRDPLKDDVITFLARRIRDNQPIELFEDGTPSLDFFDIVDVVDAAICASVSNVRDTVINISSGTMMSLAEIVEILAELMCCPLPEISSIEPIKQPPSTEYLFGPKQLCMDIKKASQLLGWEPNKDMRKIVEETATKVLKEVPEKGNIN